MGVGAVTAGAGRYLAPIVGPKVAGWWKGEGIEGPAPRDLVNPGNYRVRVNPNKLGMNGGNVEAADEPVHLGVQDPRRVGLPLAG